MIKLFEVDAYGPSWTRVYLDRREELIVIRSRTEKRDVWQQNSVPVLALWDAITKELIEWPADELNECLLRQVIRAHMTKGGEH